MRDEELLARVRELRERGTPPKRIAKALGLRPAAVAPLIRQVAEAQQAQGSPADRDLLGCWISPGWSAGLGLDNAPAEWAAHDPYGAADPTTGGLANVVIARRERASRATVCAFLVDVYCLGVKDVTGPTVMGSGSLDAWRKDFFRAFDQPELSAPPGLAQHLVHGAVAYARSLGFEPAPDFAAAAEHLGSPVGPCPIRFGRDGKPFYLSGPYDNARAVVNKLEAAAGPGNYHYIAPL